MNMAAQLMAVGSETATKAVMKGGGKSGSTAGDASGGACGRRHAANVAAATEAMVVAV